MADVRHLGRHSPELTAAVETAGASLVLLLTREHEGAPRVSISQLRALLVLRAGSAMNVTALAESLGALPSSASRLCDRLAAAGLLERSVRSEDRREVTVQLTPDGRALLEQIEAARREDLHRALGMMSERNRAELIAGLGALSRAAETLRHAGSEKVGHKQA